VPLFSLKQNAGQPLQQVTIEEGIMFLINITEIEKSTRQDRDKVTVSVNVCVCVCDHGDGTVDPLCSGTKTTIC